MRSWRLWKRKMRIFFLVTTFPLVLLFFVVISFQSEPIGGDVAVLLRNDKTQKEYIDKRGIHVIVGHYIGNELPWQTTPNLTDDLLNRNGYSPLPRAGHMGEAYFVLPSEKKMSKVLYHINKFNLLASDRIPVNRTLPDVRRSACAKKTYRTAHLPDTSVVIVYHNEAWSTLLRTVHSVIGRSPPHLLKEVILVDDASSRTYLREPLDDYVSRLPAKVRVIRSTKRIGLIRARLMGAKEAEGEVLTFLDAHCECSPGWLEPLLARIAEDRTRVVCPVIDIIHEDTFAYVRSFELHWGAFNWELHFRWYAVSDAELRARGNDTTVPFRTPVMAGGLFSIDKSYFEELGTYDEGMDIWGGENIELSFRVWLCGGKVEIAPCSHVGHVFRHSSPYTFPRPGGVGAVLYSNLARVAITWMDEWKNFYFKMNPEAAKLEKDVDVGTRMLLRQQLKCHRFQWYLDNVWPEHFMPTDKRFFGKIRNKKSGKCFQKATNKAAGGQSPTGKMQLSTCVFEVYPRQLFLFTEKGQLMSDEAVCLDSPEGAEDTYVVMLACSGLYRQQWQYNKTQRTLVHRKSKLCLDLPSKEMPDGLTLQKCSGSRKQQWIFESVEWR